MDNLGATTTQSISITIYSTPAQVLFSDNFTNFTNWMVIDNGNTEGPSNWTVSNGEVIQLSNIWDGVDIPSNIAKFGTYALTGNASWQDYDVSLRVMSEDNDELGIMFRYQDSNNYYRFSLDTERHYRRLVKFVNGTPTVLVEDAVRYELGQSYNIRVSVKGNTISMYVGEQLILQTTDTSLTAGKIALYCWGDQDAHFANVLVTTN